MSKIARPRLPFEVWALMAGALSVALGYGVVAPAIPQYASAFGVSTFAASAIVSAFALMRLVSAPFAGWAVNRLGERRTYTIGLLIVALSTGACALAMDYPQLIVLRGLGGVGSAMFSVAATALLIKLSPPDARGRVASLNAAGFLLGGLLGPVLGGLVAGFGLRAPFVFYFIMLVVAAAVVSLALRRSRVAGGPARAGRPGSSDAAQRDRLAEPGAEGDAEAPRRDPATASELAPEAGTGPVRLPAAADAGARGDGDRGALGAPAGSGAVRPDPLRFTAALRVSQYRALLASVFAFGWTSFGVRVSIVPLFVAFAWNGDAATAAWVLAAYAAGNAALIFPSGRWNDTLGRKPLLITGMAVSAAAYAAFAASPSMGFAIGCMVVAGAGSALVNPGQQATLADIVGERKGGSVVAGYSMVTDLGGVLGPLAAGAIVDWAGYGWAFGASAALLALSAIAWACVPDSRALQRI